MCGLGMEGERNVVDVVQEVSYPDRRGIKRASEMHSRGLLIRQTVSGPGIEAN